MKPASFAYLAPDSLPAVLAALDEYGYDAKPLAGGQSLIPTMNFRLAQPAVLVDLNRIPELSGIEMKSDGGFTIRAMTRQRDVERHGRLPAIAPLLAEAMPLIAHPQIRNRGTIGGSMAHADPAAELPVVAVALGATMHLQSRGRTRTISADDFFQGIFTVDMASDELLTAISFPPWPARSGWAFLEVARRHGDYALAGVAATITLDATGRCRAAKLVYLSVGDRPVNARRAAELLTGESITAGLIQAVAETAATTEIDPAGNVHASAAYQRHLVKILTGRALQLASQRAKGPS
jgi:carbon-monoxide dehydrogenase medium subunit